MGSSQFESADQISLASFHAPNRTIARRTSTTQFGTLEREATYEAAVLHVIPPLQASDGHSKSAQTGR